MVVRSAGYLEKKRGSDQKVTASFCGACACGAARGGQQDRLSIHWQEIGIHSFVSSGNIPFAEETQLASV
jgi:hypothetical protein